MNAFMETMSRIIKVMNVIAGIALTFIVLLTVCDVVLRAFGRPILGVYEVVAMAGGVVIGFVAPYTSWIRGHIFMDFDLAFMILATPIFYPAVLKMGLDPIWLAIIIDVDPTGGNQCLHRHQLDQDAHECYL